MSTPISPPSPPDAGAHRRLDDLDPAYLRAVGDLTLPPIWVPPQGAAMGTHLNKLDGDSLEFKQHRSYTPGDDVRRVDWSLYGRSKRLYTRLVQDEHQPRLVLALDTSASMATGGWNDKFRGTIELTLQLALIGLNSGFAVRVLPFGESVASDRAINVIHARQLLGSLRERLAGLEPAGPTNFDALGTASLDWRNQGAMVVVLTDLLQDVDDDSLTSSAAQSGRTVDGSTGGGSRPAPLPHLPLTASERHELSQVRAQARKRLLLSAQKVAHDLKFMSHPNIRGVLCQVAGLQDQDLRQARQIIDMESGVLQRLAFTRAASRAYLRVRSAHAAALAGAARSLNMGHAVFDAGTNDDQNRLAVQKILAAIASQGYAGEPAEIEVA